MPISKIVQNSLADTISLGPKISSVQVANSTYVVKDDTNINIGGGYIVITGSGFQSNCSVIVDANLACSVAFVSATQVHAELPAKPAGTYNIYLLNGDGGTAIRVNGLQYSNTPTWVTTSPLTQQIEDSVVSIQLSATGASSYVIQTGSSLPTGLTLASNGLISGTVNTNVSVDTTFNFTVEAIDAENQETPKAFAVTISVGDPDFNRTTLLLDGDGTNNANNNVFRDSSNNNYTITRDGDATQGSFSPFSPAGWSNYFSGATTDYLTVGSSTLFDISSSSATFTAEAWIYPQQINSSGPENYRFTSIISKDVVFISFGYTSTGILRFYTYNGNENYINSSAVITENEWQHVAVVSNAGSVTLYRNGVSVGTGSLVAPSGGGNGSNPKIGAADPNNAPDAFKGYLSNLRITNTAVYTGAFTPSTTNLTAISGTQFLMGQSNRFIDTNTQAAAKSISIVGTVRVVPFSPFIPSERYSASTHGGSLYFDGDTDVVYATEASSQFTYGTGDFEYECWFYSDRAVNFTSQETIFGRNSTGNEAVPYIYITPTSRNVSLYYSGGIVSGTTAIKPYQWYHVVVSRVSGTSRIFLNGVQEGSASDTTDLIAAGKLVVGGQWTSNGNMFKGFISGVRVRKGSGSTSVTVPTTPPTPITNTNLILNGTNASIYDWTTKNNIETLGGAKISTTQSKFGGSSLYVDGLSGSRFVIERKPVLDLIDDFTVEGWFFCDSLASGTYRRLWSFGTFSESNSFDAEFNNNEVTNKFRINFNGLTNGTNSSESSTNAIATNQWFHVAVTRSSGTIKGWLNGTNVITITGSQTAPVNKAQDVYIGALHGYETTANAIFSGYIDDFRISQFCRYTGNFTPATGAFKTK